MARIPGWQSLDKLDRILVFVFEKKILINFFSTTNYAKIAILNNESHNGIGIYGISNNNVQENILLLK